MDLFELSNGLLGRLADFLGGLVDHPGQMVL